MGFVFIFMKYRFQITVLISAFELTLLDELVCQLIANES